jgi:hypothetical protein
MQVNVSRFPRYLTLTSYWSTLLRMAVHSVLQVSQRKATCCLPYHTTLILEILVQGANESWPTPLDTHMEADFGTCLHYVL